MIDVELLREMVALAEENPRLLIPFGDDPEPEPDDDVTKGVLGASFGNSSKRRNELVSRLKGRRNYAPPVRGGRKKRRGRLTTKGNLTRALTARRSATTMKGMTLTKHAAPIHPGTGTDQSVHGRNGRSIESGPIDPPSQHTTSGEYNEKVARAETYDSMVQRMAAWGHLPELDAEHTYWTRPGLIPEMEKELARLNKRGQRYLGLDEDDAMKIVKTGQTHAHTMPDGQIVDFEAIRIEGTFPKASGYEFMAKLEHLQNEDGSYTNILKPVPGLDAEIPTGYRTAGPNCDVCQRNIYRRDTFLVRNTETGEIIQAGRDDLALYTGYGEAEQLANWTSQYADFVARLDRGDDFDVGGGGGGEPTFSAEVAIAQTAAIVREAGFVRSSEPGSTKDALAAMLHDRRFQQEHPNLAITDADLEKADKIISWVSGLEDEQLASDYMWNLKVAATNPYGVTTKQYGLIASIVTAYDREMGLIVERERAADVAALSEFVGEVGKRQDFTDLTITRHNTFEGNYGTTHVYEFLDSDNNSLVWFSSNALYEDSPNTEALAELAEIAERGRKVFEEKIVPAGGTLEGVLDKMAHTIGTRETEMANKLRAEGKITDEAVEATRRVWLAGSFSAPYHDLPEVLTQADKADVETYVRSVYFPDRPATYIPDKRTFFEVGDVVSLKATVKEHKVDEYKGRKKKQTVITRGKLI